MGEYQNVHSKIKKSIGPARKFQCIDCGQVARDWSYDGLDPQQIWDSSDHGGWYSVDPARYAPRCSRCHAEYDHPRPRPAKRCPEMGCRRLVYAWGLCGTHYEATRRGRPAKLMCIVPGCARYAASGDICNGHLVCAQSECTDTVSAKGFCNVHYQRNLRSKRGMKT